MLSKLDRKPSVGCREMSQQESPDDNLTLFVHKEGLKDSSARLVMWTNRICETTAASECQKACEKASL